MSDIFSYAFAKLWKENYHKVGFPSQIWCAICGARKFVYNKEQVKRFAKKHDHPEAKYPV